MTTPLAVRAPSTPPAPAAPILCGGRPKAARTAAVALLAASLAACGGGGGGSSSTAPSASSAPSPTGTPSPSPSPSPSPTGSPSPAPSPAPTPAPTPAPPPAPPTAEEAGRLADQATFGNTTALTNSIIALGESAWIDQQLATAPTGYPVLPAVSSNSSVGCPSGSAATCYRDNYTVFPVQRVFLANAVNGPDQLRQKVAFALSQIMVISATEVGISYAQREYQQTLLNDAFGNYRTLLQDVTLSPAMGLFLNMVNNAKGNVAKNTHPNENYGREVLQLFSIGPNQLNADGTTVLDSTGAPVPTYTQTQVQGFAAAFTGWTYPATPGVTSKFGNPAYFIGPMVAFENQHDETAKTLLSGVTTATNQTSAADLKTALDNIYNHPNVGPFIGKQLIQFLVTSNPSPAYVARITAVFNNDGTGTRGNLGAVVKAILLDPEARGNPATPANFGKLREPVEYETAMLRQFNATTDGVAPINPVSSMGQAIFTAPSVFNFYPPSYPLQNTTLVAPQFGIVNTATTLNRVGVADALIYGNPVAADPTVPGSVGTGVNLGAYTTMAADVPTLISNLDLLMTHNQMTSAELQTVTNAVNSIASNDPEDRARMALFLIATSATYQVKK